MASTYTPLGIEKMATGENAGTWGTKTNTNLEIIEQISGGFTQQSIAGGAGTTTLSVSDGSTGATLSHRMIEFTGSITGNRIVTIPLDVQTFYILRNSTSGAYTVQFKYVTGSGDSFTFATTDKGDQLVFATANDGTNPDIATLSFGDVTLTGTQTLTNKTLTTPILTTPVANAGVQLKNGSTSAGFLEFFEDSDNGTNKATLIGPAATADVTITLPAAADTLVGKATTDTLTNKSIDSDNNTITNIVNADIKSSAAIAFSKMADLTTSRALVSDGSGDVSVSAVTSTEIGYLDGVSSAIQTQIDSKTSTGKAIAMAMIFG
jgi:hypothetical protein